MFFLYTHVAPNLQCVDPCNLSGSVWSMFVYSTYSFLPVILDSSTSCLIKAWYHIIFKGNVSCSRKQRGPLMGLEPTTSTLRVRRAARCSVSGSSFCTLFYQAISHVHTLYIYNKLPVIVSQFLWYVLRMICPTQFQKEICC